MAQPEGLAFDMRPCPNCGGAITKATFTCRHCGCGVEPVWGDGAPSGAVERMMLPVGRPASAIVAGYLGLFSVLPFFGIAAIIVSLFALRTLRRKPDLSGRGRAIFGLVMGTLMTLLYAIPFVMILVSAASHR